MLSFKQRRCLEEAQAFDHRHLVPLKPLKISRGRKDERFIFPEVPELKGTPFELCADEINFVSGLIGGKANQGLRMHNLRLYRSDQKKNAGDFVVVDVSAPPRALGPLQVPQWEAFVLDLKMNGELTLGGGGAGIQLMDAERAATVAVEMTAAGHGLRPECRVARTRWRDFAAPTHVWRVVGDRRELLAFFRGLRLLRRHRRHIDADPRALTHYFQTLRAREIL